VTDLDRIADLSAASHVLCRARMECAFGPRQAEKIVADASLYIQKQIDALAEPIFAEADYAQSSR